MGERGVTQTRPTIGRGGKMAERWQVFATTKPELRSQYDDATDPTEITVFDRERSSTDWLTIGAGWALTLEEIQ